MHVLEIRAINILKVLLSKLQRGSVESKKPGWLETRNVTLFVRGSV